MLVICVVKRFWKIWFATHSTTNNHKKNYPHQPHPKKVFFCAIEVPLKFLWSGFKAPLKCCWSAFKVPFKCQQQHTFPCLLPHYPQYAGSKLYALAYFRKKLTPPKKVPFFLVVWSQANIRNTFFNQKSTWHPQVVVLRCHRQTHWQTDQNGNSITYPSQRSNSVKSEK